MKFNSLTENEEQDIPSHILKTIFGLHASVIFRPKYVWFPVHLKDVVIPDASGQLTELIVYITSTWVDLYSHQILLWSPVNQIWSCRYQLMSSKMFVGLWSSLNRIWRPIIDWWISKIYSCTYAAPKINLWSTFIQFMELHNSAEGDP